MAVVTMQKFTLCAPLSEKDRIMKVLQRKGLLHITEEKADGLPLSSPNVSQEKAACEKKAQTALAALTVLDQYAPAGGGLFASLAGPEELSPEEWQTRSNQEASALAAAQRIQDLQKELTEAEAREIRLDVSADMLLPWKDLTVPMNYAGTRTCSVIIGTMNGSWTEENLELLLAAEAPSAELHSVEVVSAEQNQTCLMVVCMKEEAAVLEEVLRRKGFARPLVSTDKLPAEAREELLAQKEAARAQQEELRQKLADCGKDRALLQFCYDDNILKAEREEAEARGLSSDRVFYLTGYLPAAGAAKLKEKLEQDFTCDLSLSDLTDEETAPVLLKNNGLNAPTENVVSAFGMPGKGEVDPTPIMAICYYFLFGLMLADAGYGLLMTVGCFIVLKKFPKMAKSLREMLKMFMYCGISTAFWGVMFGSYFGDAIPVIARTFFHTEVTVPALWLVPLEEPMKLLIYCFLFGIIHLFVGLGIKGYMCLRDKQYMDFVGGVLSWYMLLIGLILLLLPSDIFASISGAPVALPPAVTAAAKALAVVGAVTIIVFSEHTNKNFGLRIAMGAYNLYGVTSWLSDVLSYSRLLALGLASGVIATVFNMMGTMFGGGILGFILFVVVFLVGHTLNLAINLLGAYVHTNRLQFVEFFGKFYEGGGEAYAPLTAENTKYYHLEDK